MTTYAKNYHASKIKWFIFMGDFEEGFNAYGPFDTREEAKEWYDYPNGVILSLQEPYIFPRKVHSNEKS